MKYRRWHLHTSLPLGLFLGFGRRLPLGFNFMGLWPSSTDFSGSSVSTQHWASSTILEGWEDGLLTALNLGCFRGPGKRGSTSASCTLCSMSIKLTCTSSDLLWQQAGAACSAKPAPHSHPRSSRGSPSNKKSPCCLFHSCPIYLLSPFLFPSPLPNSETSSRN